MEITIEQVLEIASTYKINNNGFYGVEDLTDETSTYNFRIDMIKRVIPFIKRYCKPMKTVNKKRSITQMKNIFRRFIGSTLILTNGEFAIAMILAGFEPKNGYFNYAEKDFKVLADYVTY